MKACQRGGIYITLILLFAVASFTSSADGQVIGIVSRIKGKLIHKLGERATGLQRTDQVMRESVIQLAPGSTQGWVEILTANGPVRHSRFPVSGFVRLAGLSDEMQDQYRTALGGKVLGTRGGLRLSGEVEAFDWSMEIGTLDARDLESGLYLVLSRENSSKETGSFAPLYFRLKENLTISEARYVIVDKAMSFIETEGQYEKRGEDWVFRFDDFEYESNVTYEVRSLFTLSGGLEIQWSFAYRIFSEEDMDFIEQEIKDSLTGEENEFQRIMIRAAVFQSYRLKLSSIKILSAAGVDVAWMLEE
jgi:hypothetical protein